MTSERPALTQSGNVVLMLALFLSGVFGSAYAFWVWRQSDSSPEVPAAIPPSHEGGEDTTRVITSYRERLRTDHTLGLVNSRQALENAQATYEAVRERAFNGDRDAMERIHEVAETYRRNLIAFSPSSGLAHAVLTEIDQTLTKILLMQKK